MRLGSLFAGIGGFDLAARWMGWETAWYSEIAPYACRVLAKNFPGVPNLGDITKISSPPPVDVLAGGFPCQDISLAGKGAGINGSRSGLWSHYARIIGEIRPRYVVAENVSALRSRGLDRVLRDLMALGYDAEWHCIPASAVGAPHERDRIWIIAYAAGSVDRSLVGDALCEWVRLGQHGRLGVEGSAEAAPEGPLDPRHPGGRAGDVADSNRGRHRASQEVIRAGWNRSEHASWWVSEPDVGRVAHGVPSRVDRLRCLGNAVVPQIPLFLFHAIQHHDQNSSIHRR